MRGYRARLFSSYLLVLSLTILCGSAFAAGSGGTTIHEGIFSVEEMALQVNEAGNITPTLPGTYALEQPGMVSLPVRHMTFVVPVGVSVQNLVIEPFETHTVKLPAALAMGLPLVSDSGQMITHSVMEQGDSHFPATWGKFTGSHIWRGYQLLTVDVYPVRKIQSDNSNSVEFLDSFAINAIYGSDSRSTDIAVRERLIVNENKSNEDMLRTFVDNPEVLGQLLRQSGQIVVEDKGGFNPSRTPSLSGSAVSYLIITNEAMAPEFQRLADYKTSLGIPAVVATREYIAANFRNGTDIQETVRMFIRDAYQKWGTEYVLLGGDSDVLPARYVTNSFYPAGGSTDIPVDLYFACLDGDWNANFNSAYGEPGAAVDGGDEADFAEEVYLGRAPVSTPAAASVFVDKVMTYEATAAGSNWTNRALFAAEMLFPAEYTEGDYIILDGAEFADEIVNDFLIPCTDMEYVRMYETDITYPMDEQLTVDATIDSLNTGHYGIFNQIGHGYYFNMSLANSNFNSADADDLVNGDHLFLLYALNCASAAFDYSCLMERFIQNPNGGSVASIGAVRAAFPTNANNYQQEFYDNLFCGSANRLGEIVALSRLPFVGLTSNNYVDRWTFENYTLLGDPTVPIWTDVPSSLDVVSATEINLGPQNFSVTVSTEGSPLAGAKVCLHMDGDDYAVGTTDAAGQVLLDFLPTITGDAQLTVTGNNVERTTSVVTITAHDAYVALGDVSISDDQVGFSLGNGNSAAESGETVEIYPQLNETGGGSASGLSGTLSTTTPGVTITSATANYPDIGAGGVSDPLTPFVVSFDPGLADGTPIVFEMVVSHDGAGSSNSEWILVLKAPEVEIISIDWEDDTWGTGDGFLGNNERVGLSVQLKNFGAGTLDHYDAFLRSDDASVTIFDSLGTYDNIDLLEDTQGNVTFSLSLALAYRNNISRVVLVDNYGRTIVQNVTLERPEAPVGFETDSSEGADIISLRWNPSVSEDAYGYNVYRSLNESGPFTRANVDLLTSGSYFRDEGLELMTRYYYRVETLDENFMPSDYSEVILQATSPAEIPGFPLPFAAETSGHCAVGDIDGNGTLEIILASDELYIWNSDGTEFADGDNDSQTLGPFTNLNTVLDPAGITLAHLDDEAGLEIIVSERLDGNKIHIFKKDGSEMPGWPQSMSQWNWATPAVGDIDGDGEVEIVVNALDGRVRAWHIDGSEVRDGDSDPATHGIFYVRDGANWEWSLSGPALFDLDGDGAKDIIFGTKNDNSGLKRVMAIKYDGTDVAGFPYLANSGITANPVVGDLNGDGIFEIVIYDGAGYLHVIQQDGTSYPGFPIQPGVGGLVDAGSSCALGNMDQDTDLEIIWAPNMSGHRSDVLIVDTDYEGGTSGDVFAGFPIELPGSSEASPVVGDIDGDGVCEILHGIGGGDTESPDNLYAFHTNGSSVDGFPITLTGPLRSSPVICDLDFDTDVDIVYGSWDRLVHVWDMPFSYNRLNVPWPTFQGNTLRDGVFFSLELVPAIDEDVPNVDLLVGSPYPNPFNPSTSVKLYVAPGVSGSADLELGVYDIQGRLVRHLHSGLIASGWHTLVWDGQDDRGRGSASGLYFMRATSGTMSSVQKMTLVK
jgi:hypothetical protein